MRPGHGVTVVAGCRGDGSAHRRRRGAAGAGRALTLALGLALALAAPSVAWAQDPGVPAAVTLRSGDVVIRGGLLFDAVDTDATGTDAIRPNPGILVRNGVILQVGLEGVAVPGVEVPAVAPSGGAGSDTGPAGEEPPDVRILNLPADATVLPGLFDLHAHYAVDLFGEGRVDETRVNPLVFLANGVTSTFPAGEVDPAAFDAVAADLADGTLPGPRIHRSGAYFGSARPGWDAGAMTPDSVRAEVRFWARRGVAGFKAKGLGSDLLEALIHEAHLQGRTVTAHLGSGRRGTVNPRDAILMGIDRVEHFLGGDALPAERSAYASLETLDLAEPRTRRLLREQIHRFIEHGVRFDATLTAYDYFADRDPEVYGYFADEMGLLTPYVRRVVEERLPREPLAQFGRIYRVKLETVRLFVEEGGGHLLTVGTDHPSWGEFFSGFAIHREMHALSRAGIPNAVVLRAATINGARALDLASTLGTVEAGKLADLVVVDGDPVEDIRATRRVRQVIRGGRVYDPSELLDRARGRLGPAGPEEAWWWKGRVRLEGRGETGAAGRTDSGADRRGSPTTPETPDGGGP